MTALRELTHRWEATARQSEVLRRIADAPEGATVLIGYGGAAGGAKTNLAANLALDIAMQCPGSRTLVGRQDFVDLRTTTLTEFDSICPPAIVKRYDSSPTYRDIRLPEWPDGVSSRIYFRGLKDWKSILSDAFGFIIIDEAHEVSLSAVRGLLTRLRHQPEKKWGIVACFNPFPSWCTQWFKRGKVPEDIATDPMIRVHFVQSLMDDNPHLRAGYRQMLTATLDPYMRAVMVEGKDDVVPDAVYPQLDMSIHLRGSVGRSWKTGAGAIGVDYGTKHNSAVVAITEDSTGRYWVRECWAKPGGDEAEIARVVGELKTRYGIRRGRVDPIQDVLAQRLGFEVAEKGQDTRKKRISSVTRLLNREPGIEPGLYFDEKGEGVIELFEEMMVYRYEEIETDTKQDWVVVRKNEDRVAAMEYGIEELVGIYQLVTPEPAKARYSTGAPRREYMQV